MSDPIIDTILSNHPGHDVGVKSIHVLHAPAAKFVQLVDNFGSVSWYLADGAMGRGISERARLGLCRVIGRSRVRDRIDEWVFYFT
jgi:hypothetical protein